MVMNMITTLAAVRIKLKAFSPCADIYSWTAVLTTSQKVSTITFHHRFTIRFSFSLQMSIGSKYWLLVSLITNYLFQPWKKKNLGQCLLEEVILDPGILWWPFFGIGIGITFSWTKQLNKKIIAALIEKGKKIISRSPCWTNMIHESFVLHSGIRRTEISRFILYYS